MVVPFIRDDINYGFLIACEIEGQRFYVDHFYSVFFREATILEGKQIIGEFHPTTLRVSVSALNDIFVYVDKESNLRTLAEAISKTTDKPVTACVHARILARWEKGRAVGKTKKLSDFYKGITKEEDARYSF